IGFSEMIAEQAFGPIGQHRYVDYARNTGQAGQQMLEFVVDVLTIAQLEAGRFMLELEIIDLAEAVEAILDDFRQSEAGQGREIILTVSGTPNPVNVDRRALQQMLHKLLSNAAKFSGAETPIEVTIVAGAEGFTRIGVADQGSGVSPETAVLAIHPFRLVDGRLARKHGGTGLGLSVVNGLTERHGGRLTIDSVPGRGTRVSIDLPAVHAQAERPRIAAVAD